MASSNQSPGGHPTNRSKPPYLEKCFTCDAMVDDMMVHKKQCHPETYWCEECEVDVETLRECYHNERYHSGLLGLVDQHQRHPVEKINFTRTLEQMRGTRDDWEIIPKSKFEVLWDEEHNTALVAIEDLTSPDLAVIYDDRNREWHQESGVRCVDKQSYGKLDPPMEIGHLAARANYRLSQTDTDDTFSIINGIPQKSAVNHGKVKRLENHYRRLVRKWDGVIQSTGPIYDFTTTEPQKSQNGLWVYVPTGFFKVMKMRRKGEEPKVQAFRLDHSNVEYQSLLSMRSTVEEIAKLTQLNLDMFANCKYTWDKDIKSFTCLKCLKTYSTQTELDIHSEVHLHYCWVCKSNFKSKEERDDHMGSHLNHPCEICGKVFVYPTRLNLHLEAHANERKYACELCPDRFNTKKHLDSHIKHVHDIELVECPIEDCGKEFNRLYLKQHLDRVHGEFKFVCDTVEWCQKPSKTKQAAEVHFNLVHDFVPKVKCPEPRCTRLFPNMKAFLSHRKLYHKKTDKFPKSLNKTVEIDPKTSAKLIAERRSAGNQKPGYLTMAEWMENYSKASPTTASSTVTSGALEDLEDQESGVLNLSGSSPHQELFSFSEDFEEQAQLSDDVIPSLSESQAAGIASIVDTFNNYNLLSQTSAQLDPSLSLANKSNPVPVMLVDLTADEDATPADKIKKVNRTAGPTSVADWVIPLPSSGTKRKSDPPDTKPTKKRKKTNKKGDPSQQTLDNFFNL